MLRMMIRLIFSVLAFLTVSVGYAQTNFRSNGTGGGDWNQVTTWQIETPNGSNNWILAGSTPSSASNLVTIRSGDVVVITANVTIDQTTVSVGGIVEVNDAIAVTLNNGSGNDLRVDGRIFTQGESFLTGSGNLVLAGTFATGSLNAAGAIVTGTTQGSLRVSSLRSFVTGCAISYEGSGVQFVGNGHAATPILIVNNPNGVELNNTSSTQVLVSGAEIINGDLIVENDNLVANGSTAQVVLNGGDLIIRSSLASRSATIRNLMITSGNCILEGTTNSVSLLVNGDASLVGGAIIASNISQVATITVNGNLNLTGDDVTLNSGSADITLTVNGDITGTGFIEGSGSNANVTFGGTGALTNPSAFDAGSSFEVITFNRPSGLLNFTTFFTLGKLNISSGDVATSVNLVINSDINLASGTTFSFVDRALTLRGRFNASFSGGTLVSNANSALSILGTGVLGTLEFAPSGNTLQSLTLFRPTAGTLVSLNSSLTITNSLALSDGVFNNISGLNLDLNCQLLVSASASLIGVGPAGVGYNITYSGSTVSTGVETQGSVINITNNCSSSLRITNAVSVNGTFFLNSGVTSFFGLSASLTMGNGSTIQRSGTATYTGLIPNGGPYNIIYNGTTYSTGSEARGLLNNCTMNCTGTVTIIGAVSVTGNIILNAGVLSNAGGNLNLGVGATLNRNGTATLTGLAPSGGAYNLVYNGTTYSTGVEAQGLLSNVTSNLSGNLTLSSSLVVLDQLEIATGTFTSGSNSITTGSFLNNGIFVAPSTTLILSEDLTNLGTFTHNNGEVIFAGTSTVLGSFVFNDVTIQNSSVLNEPIVLDLQGNFTNNGTFNTSAGLVRFSGTSVQAILGSIPTTFNDLEITNALAVVNVEVSTNISGTLTLGANSLFDADGTLNTSVLTMLSTSDAPVQDARIAEIPSGASVVGNVTVQRFMSSADNDDRFISSPVTGATVAQLQDDFFVTGNFTGTSFPCAPCDKNNPSLNYYNETVLGSFQNGYSATPVPGGNNTEVLIPGRGYDAWMYDNTGSVVLDVSGTVNQGLINFPISRTNSVPPVSSADGWNLIGNPYPSSIQWNNGSGWSRNLIDPVVFVWDRVSNSFLTFNHITSVGNLPGGIISMGQGFWVYAYPGAPSMSINEQAKVANLGTTSFYRTISASPASSLKISILDGKSSDAAFLIQNEEWLTGLENIVNSPKLILGIENVTISILDEDFKKYAHFTSHTLENKKIDLSISTTHSGEFELSMARQGEFDYSDLYLVDQFLGKRISIRETTSYKFTVTQNPETGNDRFYLLRISGLEQNEPKPRITYYPNPTLGLLNVEVASENIGRVTLVDNMGKTIVEEIPMTLENGINKGVVDLSIEANGVYFLKAIINGKSFVEKIIKQ